MAFKKGKSGNPKGRKPLPLEKAERSVLLEVFDYEAEEAVVNAMIAKAKKGSVAAASWLWDRKYGKVPDRIAGHEGGALEIVTRVGAEIERA